MIKNPQPTPQDIVGTQMLLKGHGPMPGKQDDSQVGLKPKAMKIFLMIVFLIFDCTYLYSVYSARQYELAAMDDYRIVGCIVEEQGDEYLLHIDVESLNGQEQIVEIYMNDVMLLPYDDEHLLPAYETATINVRVIKARVDEKEILQLKTYEPQEWEVVFP